MEFKLKDKVIIKELDWKGRIRAIFISEEGTQYKVRYFYEGSAKEIYFFADELEIQKDK